MNRCAQTLFLVCVLLQTPSLEAWQEPPVAAPPEDVAKVGEVVDEIVVLTGRQPEPAQQAPASTSVVEVAQLEREGFTVAGDELRGEPGVFFRRGEGDNDDFMFVNVRGVVGNHGNDTLLALVDGMAFVGPDEEILMTDIPYAAVESVEIVRGPVSALYGRGGIAGAINYRLVSRAPEQAVVKLAAGSDGFASSTVAAGLPSNERWSLFGAADYLRSDGWRAQNEQERSNLYAKAIRRGAADTLWTLTGNFLDRSYETGSVLPTLADGTTVPSFGGREGFIGSRDTGADRRSALVAARLDRQVDAARSFDVTVQARGAEASNRLDFFDAFSSRPADGVLVVNGFDSESSARTWSAESTGTWNSDNSTTVAGLSWERSTLDEQDWWSGQFGFSFECGFAFFAIEIDIATGARLNQGHPCFVDRLPRLEGDSTNTFGAAFAQREWRLAGDWSVVLGARWDRFERQATLATDTPLVQQPQVEASEDAISPKFSVKKAIGREHMVYASFGRGFSSNLGPLWQWDPSQYERNVKPTTLDSAEIGAKGRAAGLNLDYAVSAFSLLQRDRLLFVSNPAAVTDPTAAPTLATSGQRYESSGFELFLRARLGPSTKFDLSGSRVEAEWDELLIESFAGVIDRSGTEPTGVPRDILQVGIDRQLGATADVRLWWERYGDYAVTQENNIRGGGHDLLNLAATWQPPVAWIDSVGLSVTNLLDEEYDYLFASLADAVTHRVPGVPRQVRLNLRLALGGSR